MLRRDKERVVAELAERLRASETLIVADYRGLTVTQIDGVRTELLKHGARFSVVKNTLTKRAAVEAGVPTLAELLDGPSAIAFVDQGDMVGVAKTLNDTARQTRVLTIRGGILQGQPMTAEQVRDLAAVPPVDVLRGQVLAAIIAPLSSIAALVNAPLQDLLGLLDARIAQLEAGGEGSAAAEAAPEAVPAVAEDDSKSGAEVETDAPEENESTAEAEASALESKEE